MRTLGNILWHIPFLGFITALLVFLLGGLLTILVVTSPLGFGLLQYSKFLLAPFSYSMISKSDLGVTQNPIWKTYSVLIMILYLPIGIVLAIINIVQIISLFFTIVGIPVAIVLAKSLGTYLNPVNKICIPLDVANLTRKQQAFQEAQKYLAPSKGP